MNLGINPSNRDSIILLLLDELSLIKVKESSWNKVVGIFFWRKYIITHTLSRATLCFILFLFFQLYIATHSPVLGECMS